MLTDLNGENVSIESISKKALKDERLLSAILDGLTFKRGNTKVQ